MSIFSDNLNAIASTVFGGISSGLGIFNTVKQSQNADRNFDLQQSISDWQKNADQRNFDYMAQMNQIQMNREDTAHQREVDDLRAAGLSPLASVAGSTTGNVASQNAMPNPIVPQYDGSEVSNAILGLQSAMSRMQDSADLWKSLKSSEKVAEARNQTDLQITTATNEARLDEVTAQLQNEKDINAENISNSNFQLVSRLKQDLQISMESINAANARQASAQAHEIEQHYRSQGVNNFQYYSKDQFREYQYAWQVWNQAYNRFVESNLDKLSVSSESSSELVSKSRNSSFGVNSGVSGVSTGTSNAAGKTDTKSESSSSSIDNTRQFQALLHRFYTLHPVPIMRY